MRPPSHRDPVAKGRSPAAPGRAGRQGDGRAGRSLDGAHFSMGKSQIGGTRQTGAPCSAEARDSGREKREPRGMR